MGQIRTREFEGVDDAAVYAKLRVQRWKMTRVSGGEDGQLDLQKLQTN
jgi:hypothetical protein